MKKLFTLICAFVAWAGVANAATADDVAVCKHSYVLVCDEYTNNGTGSRTKGGIFGDGFFLDVTGGSVATNKGKSNPAEMIQEKDEEGNVTNEYYRYGEAFAKKYGEYGEHLNSLRLKNAQDVICMKVTAKSKLIFLLQGNNKTGKDARWPKIATNAALTEGVQNDAPTADFTGKTEAGFMYEWTAPDDMTIYIGSYNGDMFVGYIIVEANEAPGTPSVKVGAQTYENGLYFREVTCKANTVTEEGSTEASPTVVTYTTDGSTPTAASTIYTAPIKCYADQVVKFQAYGDFMGDGKPSEDFKCEGADNEGIVTFSFNAPSIAVDGSSFTVNSEYEGAKNYVTYGEVADKESNGETLTESATVTAYSKIVNGSYATFTTKTTTADVLAITPITEEVTVTVSGSAVVDEEATASSTDGSTVYAVQDGVLNADKTKFFNKVCQFKAIANADAKNAKYQVPAGQEAYLMFGNDSKLYFEIGCDSVDVEVVCSKNSCKTLNEEEDAAVTTDRKCYVNVSGKTYGYDNCVFAEDGKTVESFTPAAEIKTTINFGLTKGSYYFAKYSGTGNILISSINIKPATASGIQNVTAEAAAKKIAKRLVNGQIVIETANGTFNAVGARVK